MELTKEEQAEDDRVKEAAELIAAKARMMFDDDTMELDCRKQRCTDAKHNTRIILPGPLSPRLERELESRRMEWIAIYDAYVREFCDEEGVQEDNLTESEAKGLKTLKKRVAEGSLVICETDKSGRFAIMSQEEYLAAGEKHVAKDEEVNLEFLLKNQNRLNGHVSMLLKTFNAGADWNHQARLRATKLTHSLSVAPLYLLFKDHKGWTVEAGGPPPTRPVASAGGGQDDHLSETISTVLEPVANKMKGGMETTSTPDFISKIVELNKKEFNCEEIDLAEVDRALDEKTSLHEDPNQMRYSSSNVEESVEEISIPEEELEEGEVDYSTPCPWQTGKEDCECSVILNDSSEESSFQKDGRQEQPATINGLSCRWAGTEFERVAIACTRMEGWCERGWTLRSEILEWLSSNSEAKLVEEAAEMVDGLDTLWEKDGRDKTD